MEVVVVETMMIAATRDRRIRLQEGMLLLPGLTNHHHHHHPCPALRNEPHGVRIHNRGVAAIAARLMDSNLTAILVLLLLTEAQLATVLVEELEGLIVITQDPPDRRDILLLPDLLGLLITVLMVDLPDPLATDTVCLIDHQVMPPLVDHQLGLTTTELMV